MAFNLRSSQAFWLSRNERSTVNIKEKIQRPRLVSLSAGVGGQGWIRTIVDITSMDLQSISFNHSDTYPLTTHPQVG
jgi:hypothetical protein